jgi:phospholipid transport system transporter-binding protein
MVTSVVAAGSGSITVSGALTFTTAREARIAGLDAIAASEGREIVVDCGAVSESDSAGLAVLLDWLGAAQRRQLTLRFSNVPQRLSAIAQISEIEDALAARASS